MQVINLHHVDVMDHRRDNFNIIRPQHLMSRTIVHNHKNVTAFRFELFPYIRQLAIAQLFGHPSFSGFFSTVRTRLCSKPVGHVSPASCADNAFYRKSAISAFPCP